MRRRLLFVLAAWLVLLAASHLVRYARPAQEPRVDPPDRSIELSAVRADGTRGSGVPDGTDPSGRSEGVHP